MVTGNRKKQIPKTVKNVYLYIHSITPYKFVIVFPKYIANKELKFKISISATATYTQDVINMILHPPI